MENKLTLHSKENENLEGVAREILKYLGSPHTVLFNGPMGAGKTTLISALCRELGLPDDVASPTFAIINQYGEGNEVVYHFDFYRIEDVAELYDLGVEDYFEAPVWNFVEWPERGAQVLPQHYSQIDIEVSAAGERTYRLSSC